MKFKVLIGDLTGAVSQIKNTVDRLGSSSNIYLQAKAGKEGTSDALYLYSTDMGAETLTKIDAKVEEPGETLVNPEHLVGGLISRDLGSEIELVTLGKKEGKEDNRLRVTYDGSSKYHIAIDSNVGIMKDRVHKLPYKVDPSYTLQAKELSEFVRRSQFCIPKDDTGQSAKISCLHLTDGLIGYEGQATDGKIIARMAVKSKVQTPLGSIKVPESALVPLNMLFNSKGEELVQLIKPSEGKMFFRKGNTLYGTALLAGAYPNLKPILEGTKTSYRFRVPTQELKGALARANSFVSRRPGEAYVHLSVGNEKLEIKVEADSALADFSDVVPIEHIDSKPPATVKIILGIDYLINIIGGSRAPSLEMGLTDANQPIVIDDPDEDVSAHYVLMGVRR